MEHIDTRDTWVRLLDAAEQVLATEGFAGLSLRRVTDVAGVNLAAVHHTFGSKDALLRALLAKLLQPVTSERLHRLDATSRAVPHTVEDLLQAFLEPLLNVDRHLGLLFIELMLKPRLEGNHQLVNIGWEAIEPGVEALINTLVPLLPDLSREIIQFRVEVLLGMAGFYALDLFKLTEKFKLSGRQDRQQLITELVTLTAAGLQAPTALPPAQRSNPQPDGAPLFSDAAP